MVERTVNQLDPSTLRDAYRGVGSRGYPPGLMLKIVLFETLKGQTSPAQWHQNTPKDDVLKWLGRGIAPSRTTWYEFRDRADKFIHQLNDDLVRSAVAEGLVSPQDAAQDGTTIRSHASRHQAFNKTTLLKREAHLEAAIAADIEQTSLPEPAKWLPKTPDGRLQLQGRMEVAMECLEQRLAKNAKKDKDSRRLEKHVVVSLTDPLAPFGRDKEKTFCFLYSVQYMVCRSSSLVLGYSVSRENTDVGTIAPMIDKVQPLIGGTLKRVLVDAAYTSLQDLLDCEQRDVELLGPVGSNSFTASKQQDKPDQQLKKSEFTWLEEEQCYQCPEGHAMPYDGRERFKRHNDRFLMSNRYRCPSEICASCPLKSRCTTSEKGRTVRRYEREDLLESQREKMEQADIKSVYRERGQIIERLYADGKEHRNARRFNGRGLARARPEVGLLVMAQNILALDRIRKDKANPKKQTV